MPEPTAGQTDKPAAPEGCARARKRRFLPEALVLAALCAAGLWIGTSSVFVGGNAYARRAESLDLRREPLTAAEYRALREKLPDCAIRWSIPIGGRTYDSAARSITVSDFSADEAELFLLFDDLEQVDARGCDCYPALLAVQALLPGCEVRWTVTLGGVTFAQDTEFIALRADQVNGPELLEKLAWLPAARTVRAAGTGLSPEEQTALLAAYPRISFSWQVALCGGYQDNSAETISLAGRTDLTEASLAELADRAALFPALRTVDLTDCGFSDERLLALRETLGSVDVVWSVAVYGVTVSTAASALDLSGIPIGDLAPLEAVLPCLNHMEKIDMCDCGPSDEEMDALNRRYESIRFIWAFQMGAYRVRTDAVGFIGTSILGVGLRNEEAQKLRYCEDLRALDLGHRSVTDLSFLRYTPHLKYLIVSCSPLSDLSPVAGLQELVWVEADECRVTDWSPLLECPALVDLNICFTPTGNGEAITDVVCRLTGLERFWYSYDLLSPEQEAQIQAALPRCRTYNAQDLMHPFAGGWRYHERYYEMRDLLGMYYMADMGMYLGDIKRLPDTDG